MKNISRKPTLAVAAAIIASVSVGFAFQKGNLKNAESDQLLEGMAKHAKVDPAHMKEIGYLSEKASNPKEHGEFTEKDFVTLVKYSTNSNFELRRMSYSTMASLRKTPFREKSLQMIQDLKTSKDTRDQDNYLIFAYKLDSPDWKSYAIASQTNPRMADTAKHLLKTGGPRH